MSSLTKPVITSRLRLAEWCLEYSVYGDAYKLAVLLIDKGTREDSWDDSDNCLVICTFAELEEAYGWSYGQSLKALHAAAWLRLVERWDKLPEGTVYKVTKPEVAERQTRAAVKVAQESREAEIRSDLDVWTEQLHNPDDPEASEMKHDHPDAWEKAVVITLHRMTKRPLRYPIEYCVAVARNKI